ncbi:MAG TPA: Holliday junction branch migration protein RuvA [Calditrichia bacterium]|nr:Holliday junction branch migration protein RuvA [Calditrichota bacterium]HQU72939.1 Holliday junction branch migration protein RuvA [Calditrichia bacterium]HQV32388.1 Holliday junction branch migration protein RuvA [Calditrichia bacterium]
MIERVTGKVLEKSPTFCVLDCHGIGIGLHISLQTFQYLEKNSREGNVTLSSYLHVREDILQLYGFAEPQERRMFELLISVSGVGPKVALAILSGMSVRDLRQAIAMENVGAMTRIPGIGKKTAQRLILELKEKLQQDAATAAVSLPDSISPAGKQDAEEAVQALVALGFKPADAHRSIQQILSKSEGEVSLETLIKTALKESYGR